MFNTRLWEVSILRLNQLGYFEPLKEEDAADIKRDTKTNTVDITLKVKERGKNSIGLNGGVSGIAGSFVGFNYSTNNFLGLGETLSLERAARHRMPACSFGFTEPYLFDRPIQAGFTVYLQRFNFDQAREASILAGHNLIPLYQRARPAKPAELHHQRLRRSPSSSQLSVAPQLRPRRPHLRLRHFQHQDPDHRRRQLLQLHQFPGRRRPQRSAGGIRTSTVTPSYTYNTVNHPITPTAGKSIFASIAFAGSSAATSTPSSPPST